VSSASSRSFDKYAWSLLAALLACSAVSAASRALAFIAGVEIPARLTVAGRTLELASCGVRDTLWIDHYVAALYVPRGSAIEAVRDSARPKAVIIRIVEARYLPEQIPAKWLEALEREVAPERLTRVKEAYRRLQTGDSVSIEYAPRQGTLMRINTRMVARLPGQRLIDSILVAWADGDDIDTKLRQLGAEHPC
jgi:hypothetical protein